MRNQFDRQLNTLNGELIQMGHMVEQAIEHAIEAMVHQDAEKARQNMEFDSEVDQQEKDIETLCMKLLMKQQPVARDLRLISAALKMITDMERIGDQAADIADLAQFIEDNNVKIPVLIEKMAEMTTKMVSESIDAFVKSDLALCRQVIDNDDQVDDAFNQVKEELAQLMYQNLDAKAGLDLLMTAKYMERIGDHAVNLGEWVHYYVYGEKVEGKD